MNEYKTVPAFVKSVDEDQGIVTHLISVYGNLDSGNDIAHKGMFTKTLKEREGRVRVVDNHRRESVLDVVGKPLNFFEVSRKDLPAEVLERYPEATGGMMVETQFLMDTPEGKGTFIRIKNGAISEFSYGYNTMDSDYEQAGSVKIRHLRAVRLMEYGACIFGMNEGAVAVSAKGGEGEIEIQGSKQDLELENLKTLKVVIGTFEGRNLIKAFHFDKDVWTEEEIKDLGVFRQTSFLTRSFNDKFNWEYSVHDVYEKYLIATSYDSPFFFKVAFTEDTGSYTFTEREKWEIGTLEFVATETEAEAAAKARLIEFELALFDMEAGPALPPT